MRVSRSLALLACAAVALAAGCNGSPPEGAEGRDVVRPALGFAIDVPEGWTWRDLAGDVVLEIFRQPAPAKGEGGTNDGRRGAKRSRPVVHVVVVDREDITLDEWADQTIASSKEMQVDLDVGGREGATLADGREALAVTLNSPRGIEPLIQRMLLVVTEGRAYALLATVPESDMATTEKAVTECFDSFVVW